MGGHCAQRAFESSIRNFVAQGKHSIHILVLIDKGGEEEDRRRNRIDATQSYHDDPKMVFEEGLLHDTRCHVDPRRSRVIDYELDGKIPTSKSGDWTGVLLVKLEEKDEHYYIESLGKVMKCKRFELGVYTPGTIVLNIPGISGAFGRFQGKVETGLIEGQWFVIAFTISSSTGEVLIYHDGQPTPMRSSWDLKIGGEKAQLDTIDEQVDDANFTPAIVKFGDHVTLGDEEFNGWIGRFSLYDRVLSAREIELLSWEYLNPRVVEIRGKEGEYVNMIKFVFSDGRHHTYGGKGGDKTEDARRTITMKKDECVVSISILIETCVLIETSHNRSFALAGPHGVYGDPWRYARSSDKEEVFDLYVACCDKRIEEFRVEIPRDKRRDPQMEVHREFQRMEEFHVNGVVERDICTDEEQLQCREDVERGYLAQLKIVKDEATKGAEQLSWQSSLPTISDWEWDAKWVWWDFLRSVRTELLKPPRFLDTYVIDPGPPLHVSATTVVVAASWKERRVALKFMVEIQHVLAELEGRADVSPKCVVPITAIIADESVAGDLREKYVKMSELEFEEETIVVQSRDGLAQMMLKEYKARRTASGHEDKNFQFCIVLLLGDQTLRHALDHDQFAGKDWPLIRKIASDLANALYELHSKGARIHADVKPHNILRVGTKWQLIDMDVSCRIGEPFGDKKPSSGYCPPEMAKAWQKASDSEGRVDAGKLGKHYPHASVAYDLWSLGCVLFEMTYGGRRLFTTDKYDNLSAEDLEKLATWIPADRNRRLEGGRLYGDDADAAKDLLKKLLDPSPAVRKDQFEDGVEMLRVLDHPFFGKRDMTVTEFAHGMRQVGLSIDELRQSIEQVTRMMSAQFEMIPTTEIKVAPTPNDHGFDKLEQKSNAQFEMLSAVLKGVDDVAPKLVCFVPADDTVSLVKLFGSPTEWFNCRVKLFFVDPVSLTPVLFDKNAGFELFFPRDWAVKSLPYLKLGLTALKIAVITGRLTEIPIPNFPEISEIFLNSQLDALATLKNEAIDSASSWGCDPNTAHEVLEKVDNQCQDMLKSMAGDADIRERESLGDSLAKPLQKSAEELRNLLEKTCPGWKDRCGLIMVSSPKDGCTEWVLPKYEEEFRLEGRALLGKHARKHQQVQSVEMVQARFAAAGARPAQQNQSAAKQGCCWDVLGAGCLW